MPNAICRWPYIITKAAVHASGEASEVELDKSNILLVGPTGTGKT